MEEKNQHTNRIEKLISAYHLQSATKDEKAELLAWIKESDENKNQFQELSQLWHVSAEQKWREKLDVEQEFLSFKETVIDRSSPKKTNRPIIGTKKSLKLVRWAVAAVVVGFGFLGILKQSAQEMHLESHGNILSAILPDSSIVTLNKNSSVTYNQYALLGKRKVKMEGEVYFEVTKDKKHPFEVKARDVRVQVVGTAFNINASTSDVGVYVTEGIVDVFKNKQRIRLTAGKSVTIKDIQTEPLYPQDFDVNILYWKTKQLKFKNTPLIQVIKTVEDIYNVKIDVEDASSLSRNVSACFDESTDIGIILEVLELSLGIKLESI